MFLTTIAMSSDEEMSPKVVAKPQEIVPKKKIAGRPRQDPVDVGDKEVILTKPPRKARVLTEESKAKIDAGRAKALATLTEQRRQKAAEKAEINKVVEEKKKQIEEVKLDKAPKVREIDETVVALRKEMEELKKQLAQPKEDLPKPRKVKKIVYEDEDSEEEVIVRRKAPKPAVDAPLEGRALLDHLFFGKK
jgi:hypothetical protein